MWKIVLCFIIIVNSVFSCKKPCRWKNLMNNGENDVFKLHYYNYDIPIVKKNSDYFFLMASPQGTPEKHLKRGRKVIMRDKKIEVTKRKTTTKIDVKPVSVNCGNSKQIKELMKQIKCIPREILVDLNHPPGMKIIPDKIIVKQCGGRCDGMKSCTATQTANVTIRVQTIIRGKGQCSHIQVTEDTKCSCKDAAKMNCDPKQKFDYSSGQCICNNQYEQKECHTPRKWDNLKCSCVCNRDNCTTGTIWDQQKCRCIIKTT